MIRKNFKKSDSEEENIFWVTMTDLLLGLAMVFMTLFVLMLTGYTQQKMQQQQTQSEIAKELIKNLQAQNIDAQVDKMTGQVKISDLELFDLNSFELSPKGKQYLSKFIPIYVNTIFSNKKLSDKIVNIVVEGHTDSQTYAGITSKEEQFAKNMDLSLKRANAVEDYIFLTGYNRNFTDNLVKTLTVTGKSYSDPVLVEGKEDFNKSRRVELKLIVKDYELQDMLMMK